MAPRMTILSKSRTLLKALHPTSSSSPLRTITTSSFLSQQPELVDAQLEPTFSAPLPPNPASGSPLYSSNWRNPIPPSPSESQSLIPLGFLNQTAQWRIQSRAKTLDVQSLMNLFADWMTSQRWYDMKQLFECWVQSLDKHGEPNKPDVNIYNHYLRANLMIGAPAWELLDLVTKMSEYNIEPNTASFNLVLKAMYQSRETEAAEKLLQRMLQTGKESSPDAESYDLVVGMLLLANQIDVALKYINLMLRSGHVISLKIFSDCVKSCIKTGRLDTLVSIIEMCKATDQNKALCPPWFLCNNIADIAIQNDNSKLAFYALEFLAKCIHRGEFAGPSVHPSLDEGLAVAALGTAGRTFNSTLLDASWAVLKKSLRQKKAPNPESYLAKISAHASLSNLQRAFSTLHEFEAAYGNDADAEELFSPFTSLYPLVVACSERGFESLDQVYYQLERLNHGNPPYKSVAGLNCVLLGCANIWDLNRAYATFEAISGEFGLTPNIHSFNALIVAFGRLKKTSEAAKVFEHLVSAGVKPNAMTYSVLVDAHLMNRDQKAALALVDEMVIAGFAPTKDMLKKIRRRCTRQMDYESDDQVDSLARKFNIRMGTENRRDMLFNLQYSAPDYAA